MIVRLVTEMRTTLLLPGIGFPPIRIEPESIVFAGAQVKCAELSRSSSGTPDITVLSRGLELHLLSHRKQADEILAAAKRANVFAAAIDIRAYLKMWWSICDQQKAERIQHVTTATDLMIEWLSESEHGKHWLHHPFYAEQLRLHEQREEERRRHALVFHQEMLRRQTEETTRKREEEKIASEERRKKAEEEERENQNPGWMTPAFDDPQFLREGKAPVGFVKPVRADVNYLTALLASEFGLLWDIRRFKYVCLIVKPGSVPIKARQYIAPEEPWLPVFESDLPTIIDQLAANRNPKRTWGR
jgi:hypothetical protein